jgi:uncharacterized membrane protein
MAGATKGRPQSPTIPWQWRRPKESVMAQTQRPVVSDHTLVFGVYLLYLAGYFFVIPALIGVVIAHAMVDDSDPVPRSHFRFQIRTFWIGMLYNLIGMVLCFGLIDISPWMLLVGIPLLFWWLVWSMVRIYRGNVLLDAGKPIANPKSWLFG